TSITCILSVTRSPQSTTLFPYTTLFRSLAELRRQLHIEVAPARCDIALYHLGNNALHAAIYRRALDEPGVVVLHDAVLQHFLLRSEEHTSELQSRGHLVCRLLLEKKKTY